ncbi:MAG: PepSY-associated TM helix domain-containing protein [Shimia sp.]|uniref:PepSY-associated TM helix domain-containing protein n=1 Tax=Shimia sp. TaxID=1954381 RepID=UPI004058D912
MTTIASPQAISEHASAKSPLAQKLYFAVWRWHFYAGLVVIPFFLMLATTGMMMMFISYFDGRDGERIPVTALETALPVSQQAQAALDAVPGTLVEYIAPRSADVAAIFRIDTGDAKQLVAVDPYTATVLQNWAADSGWYAFADDIHSDILLGVLGDRMIEIAAGLGLLLVVTGLYIWWPRGNSTAVLWPNLAARGRALLKSLHAVVGFWVSAFLVLFLLSGMAWTGVWGSKYVQAWSTFPAEKWGAPLSDLTHAEMDHGSASGNTPWALEQTLLPASDPHAAHRTDGTHTPADNAGHAMNDAFKAPTIDTLVTMAREMGIDGRFRLSVPTSPTSVWTINRDTMNSDSTDFTSDLTVHIDRYTGAVLATVPFADYPFLGKVMAAGIPLHMGLSGLWNLVVNTLVCLSVIFLSVSGFVMWIKRRPSKALRVAAPPTPADMPFWKGALLIAVLLSLAFPLLGATLLAVLAFDVLVVSKIPALKRALS